MPSGAEPEGVEVFATVSTNTSAGLAGDDAGASPERVTLNAYSARPPIATTANHNAGDRRAGRERDGNPIRLRRDLLIGLQQISSYLAVTVTVVEEPALPTASKALD
jgi:hypothetical protein